MEDKTTATEGDWDFSKERVYLQGMISVRFNFFLAMYTIMIAGSANIQSRWVLVAVLAIGAAISIGISVTLFHAQRKLGVVLAELRKDPKHPLTITDARCPGQGVGKLIGFWIPAFCCATLIAGLALALIGVIPAH